MTHIRVLFIVLCIGFSYNGPLVIPTSVYPYVFIAKSLMSIFDLGENIALFVTHTTVFREKTKSAQLKRQYNIG